jgi:hypothetical protein
MGAASALLMRTVSKLRGRASYADVFLPLIMMHMGLGMSWWGFQIQFVLPTFLLCVIVAAWSSVVTNKARTLGVREALVITLAMVFLPLCGTNGLVLSAGVILFSALVVSWYYRSPGKGLSAVGMVFAGVVITLLVDALYFVGFAKVDHHWGALTASSFLRTTVGVILAPFGVLVSSHYALTLGVVGVLGGGLLLEMLRSYRSWEPNERRYIFGLIVLSVSAIAVALTVGYGRAGRGWMPDLAWHYAVLVLPSYAGVYLLMSRMRMSKLAFMVCILVAGIYCENLPGSVRTARDVWLRTKVTDHALTTSLNVDGFVESQVSNLYFVNNEWVRGCVREGVLAFGSQGGETSRGVLSKYNKFADR